MSIYRQIPSVDKILSDQNLSPFLEEYGHALLIETIREVLQEVRKTIEADKETPDYDLILKQN